MSQPIEILFFHDVLCAWSWVADRRLQVIRELYGDGLIWRYRSYPLKLEAQRPSARQIQAQARLVRRAAREPEGRGLVSDVWTGGDPPHTSLPAMVALKAAERQGILAHDRFLLTLRRAALEAGVNIGRSDVIFELVDRVGLRADRFLRDFGDPETEREVRRDRDDAVSHGIDAVPSIVIGGEWLVSGARSLDEYRDVLKRYRDQRGGMSPPPVVH